MLIDWANIACFLYFPKIFIIDEKHIDVIDLEPEEFKLIKEILLHKVLPNAKPRGTFIEVDETYLTAFEKEFLKKVFGEKIVQNVKEISQKRVKFHVPLIEITTRCNFNCPHCIQTIEHKKAGDMNLETAINLVNIFEEYSAVGVDITGGEPSLYDKTSLIKLLEYIAEKDLIVIFSTNGSNICESLAKTLGKIEAFALISLYGFNKKSYAEYTGCVDAYERILNSIKNLHKYNVPIVVRMVYTKFHEKAGYALEDFAAFAEKIRPVDVQIRFRFAEGWGFGRKNIYSVEIGQNVIKRIENKIRSNNVQSTRFDKIRKLLESFPIEKECPKFGGHSPYVTSSGVVLSCPYIDEIVAHISNPEWPIIYAEKLSTKLPFGMKARCLIKHNYLKLFSFNARKGEVYKPSNFRSSEKQPLQSL